MKGAKKIDLSQVNKDLESLKVRPLLLQKGTMGF